MTEAEDIEAVSLPRLIRVQATNHDGTPHWGHEALLVRRESGLLVTSTAPGLEVQREGGVYVSPFHTNGHYWADRWFNVIRLKEPGGGLSGYYCNIATPGGFDGSTVSYVDLQLDVRVYAQPDGSLTYALLDEDEFETARRRYAYPDELVARCYRAVDEVIALIETRGFPFDR